MAEPKVRFRQDDGTPYPALRNAAMGDYYIERNERGEKGLPMLTVSIHSGISDGELNEEELGKRVNRSADVTLYKKAVKGDLVFNMMRAWQGAVGSTKCTGMVSPAYIVASPNKEIDPTFMNYYVQTKTIITRFNRLSYGALDFRKRLYWDSFIAAEVNIPIIEEQQKIAGFLSSVDEVITASEQEVTNLETQKKAVIKKIFSQEVRFKREDGTDFPEWEEKQLGDIAEIVGGGTPDTSIEEYWKDGSIEWFTPTEVGHDKYVNFSKRKISQLGLAKSSARLLPAGTILLTSRATIGEMSIAEKECCTNQGFQSLVVHSDVDNEFVYYCQSVIKQYGLKHAAGSTFLEISGLNVAKCPIRVPCLEEQRLIADFLSDFDEAIAAAKKELELWKELKKGLIQQLFI